MFILDIYFFKYIFKTYTTKMIHCLIKTTPRTCNVYLFEIIMIKFNIFHYLDLYLTFIEDEMY